MSRPLSDQERAALATVLAEHGDHNWSNRYYICICRKVLGDDWQTNPAELAPRHAAHVTEQLAAVVQIIVDEREAGQG